MSEVLRDLVVSLSLKADNFSRNINSINRQMPLDGDNKKTAFTHSVAYYPADGHEKQSIQLI